MIDIQLLRNDIESVKKGLANRGYQLDSKLFSTLEKKRKLLQTETENLQAQRNQLSKMIGQLKSQGKDTVEEFKSVSKIGETLNEIEKKYKIIQDQLDQWILSIPNIPHYSIPIGKDETDNIEIKRNGEVPTFSFPIKDHVDIGEKLGLDIKTGAALSGSRFTVLKGPIARLHRALAQFMIDTHTQEHGYTEYYTPYIVNAEMLYGTGQLPKFAEDAYKVTSGDKEDNQEQYLISTAEITLTNSVRESILKLEDLPLKLTAHSPCFRSEAGSHGKDTRGLIRQHQFDKVEMVQIVHPDSSYEILEEMTQHAEKILSDLELPYRILALSTGDMGFSAAKTYDLEVWMPSQNTYREISSCSNCEDFQARRMKARFKDEQGKNRLVHTLNGSGVAVGRALAALLENHQNEDGSINIPEKLRPYLQGISVLSSFTK